MDKEQLLYHYFSNDLNPEQEQQFNELLATDTEFKEQFDFEKDLQFVIRDKEAIDLKSKIIGFEKNISKDTPVKTLPRNNYRKWAMAASIALIVGLGYMGYNSFIGTNYGDLYNSNFQEYPNTVFAITRGETVESIERDGFAAYEAGNYQTAIDNFNKIPAENKQEYLDFYLAQSHLSLGQLAEAKQFFNKAISSNSEFLPEARWYLALISIKEKDKAGAINQLRELTSNFEFNKDKALELLNELE
jgi:tetratricopeptide (TPR) repeat protein